MIRISLAIIISVFLCTHTYAENTSSDGCTCGTVDFHSGADFSAPEGTAVPVADDGVVVKIEENEKALVYAQEHGGYCGRYVVVKHTYPNGNTVYTRYAQLGRLLGPNGKPMKVGTNVKAKDKIGEVGKLGLFHIEIRPVTKRSPQTSSGMPNFYAGQPGMEWTTIPTVDPGTFDFEQFAKNGKAVQ